MGSKAVCPIKRNILKRIKNGKKIDICSFRSQCNRHDKSNCEFAQGKKKT